MLPSVLLAPVMAVKTACVLRQNDPMRTRAFFFLVALVVSLLCACDKPTQAGGTAPPKFYASAVSLSPGATELISSKLVGLQFIGRTSQCNWPGTVTRVPVVMSGVKPNYEQIAKMKPSVVLYDEQLFSDADLAKFKEIGIDLFAIRGNSIEEFERCIYEMGRTFHVETNCSEYVDAIHAAVAAAEGSPPAKKLKVAVMLPGKGSEHLIAGSESFQADVVRKSQGEVVGPKGDRFVSFNAESFVAQNPDVIICAGSSDSIEKDSRLQTILAVRKKRVFPVDPDILLRRGARVPNLIRGIYAILSEASSS